MGIKNEWTSDVRALRLFVLILLLSAAVVIISLVIPLYPLRTARGGVLCNFSEFMVCCSYTVKSY